MDGEIRTTTLRTSVSMEVKQKFASRCSELNMRNSDVLRQLILFFLADAHGLAEAVTAVSATKEKMEEKKQRAKRPPASPCLLPVPLSPRLPVLYHAETGQAKAGSAMGSPAPGPSASSPLPFPSEKKPEHGEKREHRRLVVFGQEFFLLVP